MLTRLLAAAVGLAVLLPSIVYGGPLAVHVVAGLAAVVCLAEYAAMAFPDDRWVSGAWLSAGFAAWYGSVLYMPPGTSSVALSIVALSTMIFVTLRPEPVATSADRTGRHLLGILWVGLLAFLPLLRELPTGLAWVFGVLVISWCGDTGGYFAGRFFGKHKLYPLISPKKTWEGVAGGVLLATLGLYVLREVALPALTVVDVLVLGPTLCLAGVVGDLSESMLKRALGVKDSGWIMPGHGGLLDRIDSVLFVAPLLYGYVVLVKGTAA